MTLCGSLSCPSTCMLPQRVVGILHRQRRQCMAARRHAAVTAPRIGATEIARQGRERGAVAGDVMQQQQQDVLGLGSCALAGEPSSCRSSLNRCARSGGSAERSKPCAAAVPSSAARSSAAIGFATSRGRAALDRQHLLVRHPERLGEHGAQALVPRHQVAERKLQCFDVEIAREPHRQRDRVGRARAFQPIEEPQPALRIRQRHLGGPRHDPQRFPRPPAVGQPLRQRRDGRGLEQAADRDLDLEGRADAADQSGGQQRMAAELEEVVVDADLGNPQRLGEQRAQHRFLRACAAAVAPHSPPPPAPAARGGRACRSASAAAAPASRTPTAPCSPAAAPSRCCRSAAASGAAAGLRHHVGHEPQRADASFAAPPSYASSSLHRRIAARDHRGLRHRLMPQQRRLDLARLDAEAAQLDLRVRPAEEVEHAVASPARQVAGAVHPAARGSPNGSATNRSAVRPARPR